jgi:hypothetical protein
MDTIDNEAQIGTISNGRLKSSIIDNDAHKTNCATASRARFFRSDRIGTRNMRTNI